MSADQWTPGERLAAIVAQEINDAPAEELIKAATDDVLREWARKVREVGTAKGWSVWAAAFMDPDVPFVDTGMPSTESIVAELRRLDRVAVLREASSIAERLRQFEPATGARKAAQISENIGVLRVVEELRRRADEGERGKDTSDGRQPSAGESTPALAELLRYAEAFEIPRPGNTVPLLLERSYAGGDRWSIGDREGRRWDRELGFVYERLDLDERTRTDTRFPLAEAWPFAHRIAAGEAGT